MRFGDNWSEEFEAGSQRLRARRIKPADKAKLSEGLEHLSDQSQYLRFFTAKTRFTAAELEYLTEVDGYDHFAIGVALLNDDGSEGEGVAVGRFVRLADERNVAEPAIAVTDAWQRRGLGHRLMLQLIEAGRERDVEFFRAEFLGVNQQVRRLLEGVSSNATFEFDGSTVQAQFPLSPGDDSAASESHPEMYTFLRLVGSRLMELRRYIERVHGYSGDA